LERMTNDFIDCPPELLPNGTSASSFDPATLRAYAEACNRHAFAHKVPVESWVILYLLDKAGLSPA
jgi:hypothetical protein